MYNYFTHTSNNVLSHQIMNMTTYMRTCSLIDVVTYHLIYE